MRAFERSGARHVAGASVWSLARNDDATLALAVSTGPPSSPSSRLVHARAVIAAPGAIERPVPVPGWTLPGVMSVGAAQILFKTAGIVASRGTVIAGAGPLLWLYAWQCLEAGGTIDAILETTPKGRLARSLAHAPGFVASHYLAKGLALVREVRSRVRVVEHVDAVEALGDSRVSGVRYLGGRRLRHARLRHAAAAPGRRPARDLRARRRMRRRVERSALRASSRSSTTGAARRCRACGSRATARASKAPTPRSPRGALAALSVANALGRFDAGERDRKARPLPRDARAGAARARVPRRAVPACRRVPRAGGRRRSRAAARRSRPRASSTAARAGAIGPNQAKALTRCGMGPCQGRYCAATVTALLSATCGIPPAEVGTYRQRFPIRPVTLGEIASLPGKPGRGPSGGAARANAIDASLVG